MSPRWRTAIALAAISTLALAVRLLWAHWADPFPASLTDSQYYHATALSMARSFDYSVSFDSVTGFSSGGASTAFWPPGYSFVLGTVYAILGENLTVARTVNAVCGALTVIPVYAIGRRLFGHPSGLLASVIAALLPSLVFWSPVLLSETTFTLLFATSLAFLLHAWGEHGVARPISIAIAGVMIGIAALFRGQALVLLPAGVVWASLMGRPPRRALADVAALSVLSMLVIAPWTVRNIIEMDSQILLSSNAGYNLRIGHAPYSNGRYVLPSDLWDEEPDLEFRETRFNELGRDRALEYAINHPVREVELAGRKIMWLWRPDSDALNWATNFGNNPLPDGALQPLRLLLNVTYFVVLGLATAGLAFANRQSRSLILSLVGLWTALHVVFFGEPRFHLPMLVVIVPAAAAGIAGLPRWLAQGGLAPHRR